MTKTVKGELTEDQALKQADSFLRTMGDNIAAIRGLEAEYARKKKQLDDEYAERILFCEDVKVALDVSLKTLMQENKDILFGGEDVVYLTNGQLTFAVARPIAYPRKKKPLIEVLEAKGFKEVVKVEKSYDRDAIEKWSDEQLALVGLKRKAPQDVFDYTLKEAPCPSPEKK